MEALLGLPVDNAIRETETVSDVAHNIRCVLDQVRAAALLELRWRETRNMQFMICIHGNWCANCIKYNDLI